MLGDNFEGMDEEVGERFKREGMGRGLGRRFKREGTYVYL